MADKKATRAPLWFRLLFRASFCAWIITQVASEVYNVICLQSYIHLAIFYNERGVDATFLNIVIVGLLSMSLLLGLVYGLITDKKLMLYACASFLGVLLILNTLAFMSLMLSHFSLDIGEKRMGRMVVSIYHRNMTAEHFYHEITTWGRMFPLAPNETIKFTRPPVSVPTTTSFVTANTTATQDTPRASITSYTSPVTMANRAGDDSGNVTSAASVFAAPSTAAAYSTTPASLLSILTNNRTRRRIWYRKTEYRQLMMLGFIQQNGFCCGAESIEDYSKLRAQPAASCRCHKMVVHIHPECSETRYRLATGEISSAWVRGCRVIIRDFLTDLTRLRMSLVMTVVAQIAVILLTLIHTANLPDKPPTDD